MYHKYSLLTHSSYLTVKITLTFFTHYLLDYLLQIQIVQQFFVQSVKMHVPFPSSFPCAQAQMAKHCSFLCFPYRDCNVAFKASDEEDFAHSELDLAFSFY